jgi:xanthine dehydrogenase accessory factor
MRVFRRVLERLDAGRPVALATVVQVSGSTPRHPGACMMVEPDRSSYGTIGGGRVELEVTIAAAEVAGGAPARRVRHNLVRDLAMCCGGTMEVYLEPAGPSAESLRRALALWDDRRPGLLVTPLAGGAKRVEPLERDRGRAPRCEGDQFLEPIWPSDRVVLFGGGHVARAIGPLAARCDFEVVVCDDGETGAGGERPPWAAAWIDSFDVRDVEAALGPLGVGDYAVILTRDHALDQDILERLLPNERLGYLGLIGSAGKIGRFRKRLEARGVVTPQRWGRLHAPIGLDIAAETPEEIAVSVVAELVGIRNRSRS